MIIVSNTAVQTVQPGQAITFNAIRSKSGRGEAFRPLTGAAITSGTVQILPRSAYKVSFHANVGGTVAGPVQLNIQFNGSSDLTTTMISEVVTTDTVFNNVSAETGILTGCGCDPISVTVVNTGANPIIIAANPSLMVSRVG